jgi:hypothetical protein
MAVPRAFVRCQVPPGEMGEGVFSVSVFDSTKDRVSF